mmetsp:Transcript_16145/g.33202  ORF Transcript_16145/g.33202 Transcript_16145/m.33202 type:complete len:227 (-) Transcript_16145:1065-1745(-)
MTAMNDSSLFPSRLKASKAVGSCACASSQMSCNTERADFCPHGRPPPAHTANATGSSHGGRNDVLRCFTILPSWVTITSSVSSYRRVMCVPSLPRSGREAFQRLSLAKLCESWACDSSESVALWKTAYREYSLRVLHSRTRSKACFPAIRKRFAGPRVALMFSSASARSLASHGLSSATFTCGKCRSSSSCTFLDGLNGGRARCEMHTIPTCLSPRDASEACEMVS